MSMTTKGFFGYCAIVGILASPATSSWAAPALGGDFNSDRVTDASDYTQWRDSLGEVGFLPSDYDVWKQNFGIVSELSAAAIVSGGGSPAGPTVSAIGVPNGPNIDWSVFFSPDPNLFSTTSQGTGGSLATEFAFEVAEGSLLPGTVSVDPSFMETIGGTVIVNPGNDPYAGAVVIGTQTYQSVGSVLGSGDVDAIFSPLGSTFFTTGGPKLALTFSTTGDGDELTLGGLVAQGGSVFTLATSTVTAVPEPASAIALSIALTVTWCVARRLAA